MTETEVISIDRHGQRKEYPSIKSAAEDVGVRPCQISTACVTAHRCAGRYWIKFQSTLPVRGATVASAAVNASIIFQSTLPVRGATVMGKRVQGNR